MALGMFLFSPLLTLLCAIGAAFGSGLGKYLKIDTKQLNCTFYGVLTTWTGLLLLPSTLVGEVYSGVWGLNTLLTLAGTACVFYPLTPQSALLGTVAAAVAFCIQLALRVNMTVQVKYMFIFLYVYRCGQ